MKLAFLFAVLAWHSDLVQVRSDPNPRQAWEEARSLAAEGKYEEALVKHIWFHENALKQSKSIAGVRRSYALSDWVRLGEKYPKALKELSAIRDRDDKLVRDGKGTSENLRDVFAINRALKENEKTVELFKFIHGKQEEICKRCYYLIEKHLVEASEYKLCLAYIPDPLKHLDEMRQQRLDFLKVGSEIKNEEIRQAMTRLGDSEFEAGSCRLVEILAGAGKKAEAEKIRDKALTERDDSVFRGELFKAINRPK